MSIDGEEFRCRPGLRVGRLPADHRFRATGMAASARDPGGAVTPLCDAALGGGAHVGNVEAGSPNVQADDSAPAP